jgi:hypothetical protein
MNPLELSFQELVDGIQIATHVDSFNQIARRATRNLRFQSFAYLNLNGGIPFLISSYPKSWTNRYLTLRYQHIDLVVHRASREHTVFSSGAGSGRPGGTRDQRRLFDEPPTPMRFRGRPSLSIICWSWLKPARDGLERKDKFFSSLLSSVCVSCAPEDQQNRA